MKNTNRMNVVKLIHQEALSRADIARKTGLTRAAITGIVDDLLSKEIIISTDPQKEQSGKKSIKLRLNGENLYCIGVSLRYGICYIGIASIDGQTVCEETLDFSDLSDPEEGIARIVAGLKKMIAQHVTDQVVLGIGVSSPGPVDMVSGTILNPTYLNLWSNVAIVDKLKEHFDYKIYLERDAVAAALTQKYYGHGKDFKNFIHIEIVGNGVGSVLIINHELFLGSNGFAGEFGHISIDPNGIRCSCGNSGCIECYASINAVLESISDDYPEITTWDEIVLRSPDDERLQKVIVDEARHIGNGIVTVMNLMDLDAVIIGGEIITDSDILLSEIARYVNSRIITRGTKHISVFFAHRDCYGSFLSSATIVSEEFFNKGIIEILEQ